MYLRALKLTPMPICVPPMKNLSGPVKTLWKTSLNTVRLLKRSSIFPQWMSPVTPFTLRITPNPGAV